MRGRRCGQFAQGLGNLWVGLSLLLAPSSGVAEVTRDATLPLAPAITGGALAAVALIAGLLAPVTAQASSGLIAAGSYTGGNWVDVFADTPVGGAGSYRVVVGNVHSSNNSTLKMDFNCYGSSGQFLYN